MRKTPILVRKNLRPPNFDATWARMNAAAREEADTLLEELEQELDDDFDLGGFRERRLKEMRKQSVPPLAPSHLHH